MGPTIFSTSFHNVPLGETAATECLFVWVYEGKIVYVGQTRSDWTIWDEFDLLASQVIKRLKVDDDCFRAGVEVYHSSPIDSSTGLPGDKARKMVEKLLLAALSPAGNRKSPRMPGGLELQICGDWPDDVPRSFPA